MNTRELFEMASLDVLGLLDEREREAFEMAFRRAPPSIQAQVRREQLRFSEMEKMLPAVEPPVGLRARVMAAVRDAIAAVRTEPIATISGGRRVVYSSAPIWRAACIGFATASLVLGGFFYKVTEHNRTITNGMMSTAMMEQMRRLSAAGTLDWNRVAVEPGIRFVDFAPPAEDAQVEGRSLRGRLWLDPEKNIAHVTIRGLPMDGENYTLIVHLGGGKDSIPREIDVTPGIVHVDLGVLKSDDFESMRGAEVLAPATSDDEARAVLLRIDTL